MKKCSGCGEEKDEGEFYADKRSKDGLRSNCKTCAIAQAAVYQAANPEKVKANKAKHNKKNVVKYTALNKLWVANNPAARKVHAQRYRLKTRYGLTIPAYESMQEQQKGICPICGNEGATYVDHDHATDVIRELLCPACNFGLGHFYDNVDSLQKAIEYILKHRELQCLKNA